jgi:hypothetical protein
MGNHPITRLFLDLLDAQSSGFQAWDEEWTVFQAIGVLSR